MRTQAVVPVYLDGSYGTPSSNIFESKNAILIGSGIGVTPFAAILKSILLRKLKGDYTLRLQKFHFFWMNRKQKSFEWFLELLSRIEAEDRDGLFDLHIYLTGVQEKSVMKSSILFVAMDLLHETTGSDPITGLQTKIQLGRPNWEAHFRDISSQHRGAEIDVYFSGAKVISRELDRLSDKF